MWYFVSIVLIPGKLYVSPLSRTWIHGNIAKNTSDMGMSGFTETGPKEIFLFVKKIKLDNHFLYFFLWKNKCVCEMCDKLPFELKVLC